MKSEEQVLAIPRSDIPEHWLTDCGNVLLDQAELDSHLTPVPLTWLPRPEAEQDPGHKQLIPYILILGPENTVAIYPRQGSETRLHGLWSAGVGGHINPEDGNCWNEAITKGSRRELGEEFPEAAKLSEAPEFIGLINEEKTSVGRTHIGLVHTLQLNDHPVPSSGELSGLRWIPLSQFDTPSWPTDRFELWSRLAIELLIQHSCNEHS